MIIPVSAIVVPALGAFVVYVWLYYRANPERRILHPLFAMSLGATLLMVAAVATSIAGLAAMVSPVLFLLALAWLASGVVVARRRPPAKKG